MTLDSRVQRKTSEVVIVDFDEATVRCLLQYMYGCLPEMPRRHHEVSPFCYSPSFTCGRSDMHPQPKP